MTSVFLTDRALEFALGTGGSFGQLDLTSLRRSIDFFFDAEQRVIDTAPAYLNGEAETALGRVLRPVHRQEMYLITKVWHEPPGTARTFTPRGIREEIVGSLNRLGCDHIDAVLLHRDPNCPATEVAEVMTEACAGLVYCWGTSNFEPSRLVAIAAAGADSGPLINSSQLSLVPPSEPLYSGTTVCTSEMDDFHRSFGMPLLSWGSQTRGWLSGRTEFETLRFETSNNIELRARVQAIASQNHCTPETVALQWVMERDIPTIPIVGVSLASDLSNAIHALNTPVSRAEMLKLDSMRSALDI